MAEASTPRASKVPLPSDIKQKLGGLFGWMRSNCRRSMVSDMWEKIPVLWSGREQPSVDRAGNLSIERARAQAVADAYVQRQNAKAGHARFIHIGQTQVGKRITDIEKLLKGTPAYKDEAARARIDGLIHRLWVRASRNFIRSRDPRKAFLEFTVSADSKRPGRKPVFTEVEHPEIVRSGAHAMVVGELSQFDRPAPLIH